MDKWKTKGKGHCKPDSLLPPTRRFPKAAPQLQSDKKKEKKWSIGGFFKRISSVRECDSSSAEEDITEPKKHALSKRKTKNAALKSKPVFDHIVLHPVQKNEESNGNSKNSSLNCRENNADISSTHSQESLQVCRDSLQSRCSSDGSLDGPNKKVRKGKLKARVEARRDQLCVDSSSDEDSHKSNNSLFKFRSDESIRSIKDDLSNKRSRAARTERYIKRLSREDCNIATNSKGTKTNNNSHSENSEGNTDVVMQQSLGEKSRPPIHPPRFNTSQTNIQSSTYPVHKDAIENSPTSNVFRKKSPLLSTENCFPDQIKSDFNSLARQTLEYCTDFNKNNALVQEKKHRADSCDIRRHQSGHGDAMLKSKNYELPCTDNNWQSVVPKIIPPQPPPRDPQRRVISFGSFDNTRPYSYSFDNRFQNVNKVGNDDQSNVAKPLKPGVKNPRCYNSNDEITWFDSVTFSRTRPSSVNSNLPHDKYQKYYKNDFHSGPYNYSDEDKSYGQHRESYCKPIGKEIKHYKHCSSDSSESPTLGRGLKPATSVKSGTQLFRKDKHFSVPQKSVSIENSNVSPWLRGWDCPPEAAKVEEDNVSPRSKFPIPLSELSTNSTISSLQSPPNPPIRHSSHINPVSTLDCTDGGEYTTKRHSKNLEEALCELEAIYNSLRLGDEDLLERAERRSMEEFKCRSSQVDTVEQIISPSDGSSKESLQDERSDNPWFLRKSDVPDRLKDDMAYRRMHPKERPSSLDGQASLSQISYLVASPTFSRKVEEFIDTKHKVNREEPDVTRDDVVFRNMQYANNILKVIEPQPPFGIPLGPVTSATDSDYLHTTPTKPEHPRSRYIPKSEANIITDDLAYRNLRKDTSKDISIAESNKDRKNYLLMNKVIASTNNGHTFGMKKKRAVRSLSANLYGLINQHGILSDETNQLQNESGLISSKDLNTVHKNKYEMNDDQYQSRFKNSRYVVSDTESSSPRMHWSGSRKSVESDVDINGNSPKNVCQQRLQVFIPQAKDHKYSYANDKGIQSAPIKRTALDLESPYQSSLFTAGDKSSSEEKSTHLTVNANGCDRHTKSIEPFSESEISKYKQLCQDLENLVLLAKRDQAEQVNIERSHKEPIASICLTLFEDSTTMENDKSDNESISNLQEATEEDHCFDTGILNTKFNEENIQINPKESSDDQTNLIITNSLVHTECREPRDESVSCDQEDSSVFDSSNKMTVHIDSIQSQCENDISAVNLLGVELETILGDDVGKSISTNRVINEENAGSCSKLHVDGCHTIPDVPTSNIAEEQAVKQESSSTKNDSRSSTDEGSLSNDRTEEMKDSALEKKEYGTSNTANDSQSPKIILESEVDGNMAEGNVNVVQSDSNESYNFTKHLMESGDSSEGNNSCGVEKFIRDSTKDDVITTLNYEQTSSDSTQHTPSCEGSRDSVVLNNGDW